MNAFSPSASRHRRDSPDNPGTPDPGTRFTTAQREGEVVARRTSETAMGAATAVVGRLRRTNRGCCSTALGAGAARQRVRPSQDNLEQSGPIAQEDLSLAKAADQRSGRVRDSSTSAPPGTADTLLPPLTNEQHHPHAQALSLRLNLKRNRTIEIFPQCGIRFPRVLAL